MHTPLMISVVLLVLVSGLLIASLKRITQLKRALAREQDRNKVPVLTLSLDTDNQALCLTNDGACTAKDIVIKDCPVTLDYQFKKTVRLVFGPVAVLHPTQSTVLRYTIHEGPYNITRELADSFFAHLKTGAFETCVHCSNFQNITFREMISCSSGVFTIREIRPDEIQAS